MKQGQATPALPSPPKVRKSLDLSKQFTNTTDAPALLKRIKEMPRDITHLLLSSNKLHNFSGRKLAEIFSSIPPNVTHLDLHNNNLGILAPSEIEIVLRAIPKTVVELLLGFNTLYEIGKDLVDVFRTAIHANLILLDLSFNGFNHLHPTLLITIFAAIPRSIQKLLLQGNNLCFRVDSPAAEPKYVLLGVLPPNLTYLNLANNEFCGSANLSTNLKFIPRGVTGLDLSGSLSGFTNEQLALGFVELPPRLASLNLGFSELPPRLPSASSNGSLLGSRTNEQWAVMLHRMPTSVRRITYEHSHSLIRFLPPTKAREYTVNQLVYLTELLPYLIKLIMNYALELQDFWTHSIYTVVSSPVPTPPTSPPTLEVLDSTNQSGAPVLPLTNNRKNNPAINAFTFTVSTSTYPLTLFSRTTTGSGMVLDPSLNSVVLDV